MTFMEQMEKMIQDEIRRRTETGKLLASKFPELAGLSWIEFQERCPLTLDFITASKMYDTLNEEKNELRGSFQEDKETFILLLIAFIGLTIVIYFGR